MSDLRSRLNRSGASAAIRPVRVRLARGLFALAEWIDPDRDRPRPGPASAAADAIAKAVIPGPAAQKDT